VAHTRVPVDAVRDASHRLFGPPADAAGDAIPPMSSDAVRALDAAAHNAAVQSAVGAVPEVRTEHLLGVLALDPGGRARRVLGDLGVNIAAVKGELQCHITVNPTRPARWWKRRPLAQSGCSFCGRFAPSVGPLVNGPGVAICGACLALAGEILDKQEPAA
jgi:hypothetical protein